MSKDSANILVFSVVLVLISITGLFFAGYSTVNKKNASAGMLVDECITNKSFYRRSDLTNEERKYFSANATSLDIKLYNSEKLKVIIDPLLEKDTRLRMTAKVYLSLQNSKAFAGTDLSLLVNGSQLEKESLGSDSKYFFHQFVGELDSLANPIGISLGAKDACYFKVKNLFNLSALNMDELTKTHAYKPPGELSSNLKLDKGINYLGFDDWRYISSIKDKGLKVAGYDPAKKKWQNVDKFIKPGIGYIVYNPLTKPIEVLNPPQYRVPEDISSPAISRGWNLLYSSDTSDISQLKVVINSDINNFTTQPSKLADLLTGNQIHQYIYTINQNRILEKRSLSELKNYSGPFWVYLADETKFEARQINLSLNVEGTGDEYIRGQHLPLKLTITNNDEMDHYLTTSQLIDSCQVKLVVLSPADKVLYDSQAGSGCAYWPTLEKLSPGSKKEYNYTWKVPNNITGTLKIKAFLDYSRLGITKLVNESEVTIK